MAALSTDLTGLASLEFYHRNKKRIAAERKLKRLWGSTADPLPGNRRWVGLPEPTRAETEFCEGCLQKPTGRFKRLCLDHCHTTGKFRGWLCARCNRTAGQFKDSAELLERLANYITRNT